MDELKEGTTRKFQYTSGGKQRDGFVARFAGEIVAYENACRHIPVNLDDADNRFFTRDGQHLLCQTHGAIYEPLTGLCVQGPCRGESLRKLRIEIREETIWLA